MAVLAAAAFPGAGSAAAAEDLAAAERRAAGKFYHPSQRIRKGGTE